LLCQLSDRTRVSFEHISTDESAVEMELSHGPSPIESTVEKLCKIIVKKAPEFWEERNKAIVELKV
jgi:hypothetical protein